MTPGRLTRWGKSFEARYAYFLDDVAQIDLPAGRVTALVYVQSVRFRITVTRDGALGMLTLGYNKAKKDGTPYVQTTTGSWTQYRNGDPLPRDWWPQWLTDAYNAALSDTLATMQGIDFTTDTEV